MTTIFGTFSDIVGDPSRAIVAVASQLTRPATNGEGLITTEPVLHKLDRDGRLGPIDLDPGLTVISITGPGVTERYRVEVPLEGSFDIADLIGEHVEYDPSVVSRAAASASAAADSARTASAAAETATEAASTVNTVMATAADGIRTQVSDDADRAEAAADRAEGHADGSRASADRSEAAAVRSESAKVAATGVEGRVNAVEGRVNTARDQTIAARGEAQAAASEAETNAVLATEKATEATAQATTAANKATDATAAATDAAASLAGARAVQAGVDQAVNDAASVVRQAVADDADRAEAAATSAEQTAAQVAGVVSDAADAVRAEVAADADRAEAAAASAEGVVADAAAAVRTEVTADADRASEAATRAATSQSAAQASAEAASASAAAAGTARTNATSARDEARTARDEAVAARDEAVEAADRVESVDAGVSELDLDSVLRPVVSNERLFFESHTATHLLYTDPPTLRDGDNARVISHGSGDVRDARYQVAADGKSVAMHAYIKMGGWYGADGGMVYVADIPYKIIGGRVYHGQGTYKNGGNNAVYPIIPEVYPSGKIYFRVPRDSSSSNMEYLQFHDGVTYSGTGYPRIPGEYGNAAGTEIRFTVDFVIQRLTLSYPEAVTGAVVSGGLYDPTVTLTAGQNATVTLGVTGGYVDSDGVTKMSLLGLPKTTRVPDGLTVDVDKDGARVLISGTPTTPQELTGHVSFEDGSLSRITKYIRFIVNPAT